MSVSRRDVLKYGLLQAGLMSVTPNAMARGSKNPLARRKGPSILQGATDTTRTQFSIVHAQSSKFTITALTSNGQTLIPERSETFAPERQTHIVTKAYFSNLDATESYSLILTDDDGHELDRRTFKTLDLSQPSLKFALCSCMDENEHTPEIWQDLVAQKPDVIFFIGDSVYCDYGDEKVDGHVPPFGLWKRFTEARRTLEIYYSPTLIPIFATWDDHDFGENDSGANTYPFVAESQDNFLKFFAQDPDHCDYMERGPGISSVFKMAGQQFLMLDDRSYRIAGSSDDRYAHWGREQEAWMLEMIAAFDGMTWLLNGTQIFPQMMFKQSVSGQSPVQFLAVMGKIKATGRRVAFATGDVHFSEVSEIEPSVLGYKTYELTSSSIHSYKLPGLPDLILNSRRIMSTGEHNYLVVNSMVNESDCQIVAESRSPMDQVNFRLEASLAFR